MHPSVAKCEMQLSKQGDKWPWVHFAQLQGVSMLCFCTVQCNFVEWCGHIQITFGMIAATSVKELHCCALSLLLLDVRCSWANHCNEWPWESFPKFLGGWKYSCSAVLRDAVELSGHIAFEMIAATAAMKDRLRSFCCQVYDAVEQMRQIEWPWGNFALLEVWPTEKYPEICKIQL